jgi:hypothetical protein
VEPKLVVLDVELTGDLGGPEFAAEHQARLNLASTRLRESLGRSGLYQIVDNGPAQKTIDELKSQYRYLHDCNGCDLDLGKQLGADKVLVAWVDRVSGLILSFTYEIHDVASGRSPRGSRSASEGTTIVAGRTRSTTWSETWPSRLTESEPAC